MDNNGEAQAPFITITLAGNQIQVQTNCPPGHFFKMTKLATEAMTDRFVKQEQGQGGILIAQPGAQLR